MKLEGNEDSPFDRKSPSWVDVRILDGDGTPTKEVPLRGGYVELRLPPAFFDDNPRSITLSWIDFYRN